VPGSVDAACMRSSSSVSCTRATCLRLLSPPIPRSVCGFGYDCRPWMILKWVTSQRLRCARSRRWENIFAESMVRCFPTEDTSARFAGCLPTSLFALVSLFAAVDVRNGPSQAPPRGDYIIARCRHFFITGAHVARLLSSSWN